MTRYAFVILGLLVALVAAGSPKAGAAELLTNGGFEQGSTGWSLNAGQLEAVSAPVHDGALAGRFTGNSQPTTQFVYQWVSVQPDEDYEVSGWVAALGARINRVFLRVSWYDASGQPLIDWDSDWLPQFDGSFYRLTTGVHVSLSAARTARVTAMVQADSSFTAYLDHFVFSGPAAVPATQTPPASPQQTTPATSSTPSAVTPSPTPRPAPTRTPSPLPSNTAGAEPTAGTEEPLAFPSLTNGSFEELRDDGTPFGWRKQGGQMTSVPEPRMDGARSLVLSSQTSSTKWAYQTVRVRGGAYYVGAVDALAGRGSASVFLRISWYASADGSGPAISLVDSNDEVGPSEGSFRRLASIAVQAPSEAGSAKFRLMLRPLSGEPAIAYFDAASFSQVEPGTQELVLDAARGEARAVSGPSLQGMQASRASPVTREAPVQLANVKPPATPAPAPLASAGGGREDWAIVLALGIATTAIGLAGGYELWLRRFGRGGGDRLGRG